MPKEYKLTIQVYAEAETETGAIEFVRDELGLDIDTEIKAEYTGVDIE